MALLSQLFRHKGALPVAGSAPLPSPAGDLPGTQVRALGAIAAAVGVRPERGMPDVFVISLGDLLQRVPAKFIWPGTHDASRILRIGAPEVAPGLVRGRAEISLARLVALAPDVFRWERTDSDDPKVRLPMQKLLQQIGGHVSEPGGGETSPATNAPEESRRTAANITVVEPEMSRGAEIVTAHLPAIQWEKASPGSAPASVASATPLAESMPAPETQPVPQSAIPPAMPPEQPAVAIPPPIPDAQPEPVGRPVQLRPREEASVSTTLRAVVLGGSHSPSSPGASAPAGQILAPRGAAVPPAASSVILRAPKPAPSVLTTPAEGNPTADFAGLQNLFMTGMPLDLAGVAALTASLPGVHACLIRGVLGSAESGAMPPGLNVEEVRAASEEFARKIGDVECTTIHRGNAAIAILTRSGVCLSAVIDAGGFVPGVRERLLRVTELLAGPSPAS